MCWHKKRSCWRMYNLGHELCVHCCLKLLYAAWGWILDSYSRLASPPSNELPSYYSILVPRPTIRSSGWITLPFSIRSNFGLETRLTQQPSSPDANIIKCMHYLYNSIWRRWLLRFCAWCKMPDNERKNEAQQGERKERQNLKIYGTFHAILILVDLCL